MDSLAAPSVVAFAGTLLLCAVLRERLFPFSTLGMFAYGYRDQIVVLIEDRRTGDVAPAPEVLGSSTSGLSQEVASALAGGASLDELERDIMLRLAAHIGSTEHPYQLHIRTIAVDRGGRVRVKDRPFGRL